MQIRKSLLAALLFGGPLGSVLVDRTPAQAAGTAAGTAISNTASATYNDPNNTGRRSTPRPTPSRSRSPRSPASRSAARPSPTPTPGHASNFLPGDVVNYDFTVTNIGNAANTFVPARRGDRHRPRHGGRTPVQHGRRRALHRHPGPAARPRPPSPPTARSSCASPSRSRATAATGDVIKVLAGRHRQQRQQRGHAEHRRPDPSTAADVHTNSDHGPERAARGQRLPERHRRLPAAGAAPCCC